jgi:hypothetical protein
MQSEGPPRRYGAAYALLAVSLAGLVAACGRRSVLYEPHRLYVFHGTVSSAPVGPTAPTLDLEDVEVRFCHGGLWGSCLTPRRSDPEGRYHVMVYTAVGPNRGDVLEFRKPGYVTRRVYVRRGRADAGVDVAPCPETQNLDCLRITVALAPSV